MFALTIQTGLRISELIGLNRQDVTLTRGAHVHTIGKGRKERRTPLVPATTTLLKAWLEEQDATSDDPLFPTITGKRLSRDAVERRLARHVSVAANACPSIAKLRHHRLRHRPGSECSAKVCGRMALSAVSKVWASPEIKRVMASSTPQSTPVPELRGSNRFWPSCM